MIVFITIPWFLPAYRAGGPIQSVANLIENFSVDIEYRIFCADEDLNGEPLTGIVKNSSNNFVFNYAVVGAIFMELFSFESDNIFVIGRLYVNLLVFFLLKRFLFPKLINYIKVLQKPVEN